MTRGVRFTIAALFGAAIVCLLGTAAARSQTPPGKPLMAEQVFKDVRVLKGISVSEFMTTMGFFSASVGADCTGCHVAESGGSWAKYADDHPQKETARRMVEVYGIANEEHIR